jgi:ribosomal protein S18 acetylase RimI-like enzyme
MDFILEVIVGFFFEILGDIIASDRTPKWIRYSTLVLLIAVPLVTIILGIIYATEIFVTFFLILLGLGLIVLFLYLTYTTHRYGILRPAKKENLPEILKMYRSVIGKSGCHWTDAYPNEVTLQADFEAGNLYVLWRGKQMIGAGSIVPKNELDDLDCWYYHKNVAEIARIVIKPEYQSKGFGKHLVKKLCYKLNEKGHNAVHILVSTDNHHALNMYRETKFYCKGECDRYDHTYYAFEKKL